MNTTEPLRPVGEQVGDPARHVVLVGLPGTGKSTVAPILASAIGSRWIDLDSTIERQAGCSIPELFASVGEAGFRDHEAGALGEVLGGTPVVLATGGGVVTTSQARGLLRGACVVWLRARTDTLVQRLSAQGDPAATRPLLDGGPDALRGRIEGLSADRSDLYAQLADVVIDVDDRTPTEVARAILDVLNGNPSGNET